MMKIKSLLLAAFSLCLCATAAYAKEAPLPSPFGVVDFEKCIVESKQGQKEQENLKEVQEKMKKLMAEKEAEVTTISTNLENPEFIDGISPEAEQKLKQKMQVLQEEQELLQNQWFQMLQQANMRFYEEMSHHVKRASRVISKEKKIPFIFQKTFCFSFPPEADMTPLVVQAMDKTFEDQNDAKIATTPTKE